MNAGIHIYMHAYLHACIHTYISHIHTYIRMGNLEENTELNLVDWIFV